MYADNDSNNYDLLLDVSDNDAANNGGAAGAFSQEE